MDLYRTLRISLYLLAATGAFSIAVAERSFFYLALIAGLAIVSFLTIDRGKIKPLSGEVTAVLTLVVLYLALRPLHDDEHWQAHFPAAVAHFLCAWQGLLFFSVYGGPVLLTYCGSSLAVVVMSGVVESGPSLVARVACFLIVAIWTLYIHALWRSRQEFAGLSTVLQAQVPRTGSTKTTDADRAITEPFKRLPVGSFWETLALVAGMTAACVALGVAVFFAAPRIDGLLPLFDKRGTAGPSDGPSEFPATGREPARTAVSGPSDSMSVNDVGRISLDSRVALRVVFSKPAILMGDKKGRILLKGLDFSEYRAGVWQPEKTRETVESKQGAPISPRDPSLDGAVFHGEEVEQTVEPAALPSGTYFAAGPIVKVKARAIEIDAEGAIRNPSGATLGTYSMTVSKPYDVDALNDQSTAEHRQLQRYVRQNGLKPVENEALGQRARQITRTSRSDIAKARAIQRWLENNRSYTTNLERIHPAGDPTVHFLMTSDPEQQRGHCGLFASAFVLLCRANDLPARLCTGYAARADSSDVVTKAAIATNADAHAWAEIYFKNVGWVAFDPTPAAPLSPGEATVQNAQSQKPAAPSQVNGDVSASAETEPSQGFVQDLWNATLKFNGYEQRKMYDKISGSSASSANHAASGKGWGGWLGAALAWGAIAVAIGWLVLLFARRSSRRKYAGTGGGARARAAVGFYNDLLHALSRRGFSRRPGQTPREFAETVLRRGGEGFAPVRDITAIFEAVRYGGGELEQDEFNRLQEALDKIRDMTF